MDREFWNSARITVVVDTVWSALSQRKEKEQINECRAGAGEEETVGVGDTPGFVLWSEPVIVSDPCGYNQIEPSRNH
jgi:hypothetical protein